MITTRTQRLLVELDVQGAEMVPGLLLVPAGPAPVPGVVLLHGFSSRKERMADSIGRVLLETGIATLAIDLPAHGARDGRSDELSLRNPLALVQKWRLAVREANAAISFLASHPAVDAQRLAIAGYSVGAFLALAVAADNTLVRAVALAAGGDLPEQTPFVSLVRTVADPRRAARALAGRPLLMINGRRDRTVTPAQALSLFEAAREPKEMRWYDGGHWLPNEAVTEAAGWLATRLGEPADQSRLA
jgi:dienelactone hydrolase